MKKCCGTLGIYGLDMQARQANFHRADLDPPHLLSRDLALPRIRHNNATEGCMEHAQIVGKSQLILGSRRNASRMDTVLTFVSEKGAVLP